MINSKEALPILNQKTKCVIILSSKSSGSSALQHILTNHLHISHIASTKHNENETLFWVKAASILGLPQINMIDSEVPIPSKIAREDLVNFLNSNLTSSYMPPLDNRELIFDGWRQLCQRYAPVLVEKSPHHLHQWSALKLIIECIEELPNIEFLLIGLVRNPMDTLYSMWKRWKGVPEKNQHEWYTAYSNLLKLKELLGQRVVIIRYEDMINDHKYLQKVYQFIGAENIDNNYFHGGSLNKWRQDPIYGFKLADSVIALAKEYGYHLEDLSNNSHFFWPLYREASHWFFYNLEKPIKSKFRIIKRSL